jgi:hypothetical protein
MTEDKYVQRRDHCLLMAEVAPTEGVRVSLLRMAQLCEIEARLVEQAALRISESRAAIAKADALLEGATDSKKVGAATGPPERQMIVLLKRLPAADQGPHTDRPFRATVWQGHDR